MNIAIKESSYLEDDLFNSTIFIDQVNREAFRAGLHVLTKIYNNASFIDFFGLENLRCFDKTGLVPVSWITIVQKLDGGINFLQKHRKIKYVTLSEVNGKKNAQQIMPTVTSVNSRKSESKITREVLPMKKNTGIEKRKDIVPREKAEVVIEKIMKVLDLQKQKDLADVMNVSPATLSLMKSGKQPLRFYRIDEVSEKSGVERKVFYEAIGIEDLYKKDLAKQSLSPTDKLENSKVDTLSISDKEIGDDSAKKPAVSQASSDQAEDSVDNFQKSVDEKQEFSEEERHRIDRIIFKALAKSGKATEGFEEYAFIGILVKKLSDMDICISFSVKEENIYFQTKTKKTFFFIGDMFS